MKDGSDPLEVDCIPPIHIDGDITWRFKRISSDLNDQRVDSEGAKSKDTIKMDEPKSSYIIYLSQERTRSSWTKRMQKGEACSFV